jgi:hypothetical protein
VDLVFSLQWDGTPVDLSRASAQGRDVVVPYTVPDDAPARDYSVTVSCGDAHHAATFTVVAPKIEPTPTTSTMPGHRGSEITAPPPVDVPTPAMALPPPSPPPPRTGIWGWMIALTLVVAATLVGRHLYRHRHLHSDTRVHVVTRPSGLPVTTVHETPAHGEATHAIRLEAHFDAGIQTIKEVNDDYTRA